MTITYPSPSRFRQLSIYAFLLLTAYSLMIYYEWPPQSQEVNDAMAWNYHGSILAPHILYYIYCAVRIVQLFSQLGFIFFLSWSRWVLLMIEFIFILLVPCSGIAVFLPYESFVFSIGSLLFLFLLFLSIMTPCSLYFEKQTQFTKAKLDISDTMRGECPIESGTKKSPLSSNKP